MASTLPPGELFALDTLVTATAQGIASLCWRAPRQATSPSSPSMPVKSSGAHRAIRCARHHALGALVLTIGGRDVQATPQSVVLMPANVPHAVRATEPSRMLLIMLREREQGRG